MVYDAPFAAILLTLVHLEKGAVNVSFVFDHGFEGLVNSSDAQHSGWRELNAGRCAVGKRRREVEISKIRGVLPKSRKPKRNEFSMLRQ